MSTLSFSRTPAIVVTDNRSQPLRTLVWHRHPDTPDVTDIRITQENYDQRGHRISTADSRLSASGGVNFTWHRDLTGTSLRTESADAGTTVIRMDSAGRTVFAQSPSVVRRWQYEKSGLPGRLLSVTEQGEVTEQLTWANSDEASRSENLVGQCALCVDPAGSLQLNSIGLNGNPRSVTRHLSDGGSFTTLTTTDARGHVLNTTDAAGNIQRKVLDMNGRLSASWLRVKGGSEQAVVKSITWNAAGKKLCEIHSNGVLNTCEYEPQTQRLIRIKTERPAGHSLGARLLQDLRYEYDPVGNVLKVRNDAEERRFWRNQEIVPENNYTYDSLYQLVSATGREMASAGQANSPFTSFDNTQFTQYTRTWIYDAGSNLTRIRHSAPASGNNYTTDITVSSRSNRAVLSQLTDDPDQVDALFTAEGQQRVLLPGQTLVWTPRGELSEVTPVVRKGAANDSECYLYDAHSQRVLKVSQQQSSGIMQTLQVVYLPELELRYKSNGERLQVLMAENVRMLHWESGKPESVDNDVLRFSYDSPEGSSGLEVDGDGNLISLEMYYPFGGTAAWAGRDKTEVDYKTTHYSGKERDATGLYYYGYRYYQSWIGRWLSADPAGTIDGLNLYRMVGNNPVTLKDVNGLLSTAQIEQIASNIMRRNPESLEEVEDSLSYMQFSAADMRSLMNYFRALPQFAVPTENVPSTAVAPAPSTSAAEPVASTSSGVLFTPSEESEYDRQALAYIADPRNFTHTFQSDGSIYSISNKNPKLSRFHNHFTQNTWAFMNNFRLSDKGSKSLEPYYASHIAQYQYQLSSQKGGWSGQMPTRVVRVDVINDDTLKKTADLSEDDLFRVFFNETPNGKTTKQILQVFGLEALSITKVITGGYRKKINFHIEVRKVERTVASREQAAA